jgi:RNA polymerase sigma factor (sigma-70 family)
MPKKINPPDVRDKLIRENLDLVGFTIGRFFSTFVRDIMDGSQYSVEDIVQDGRIGLMRACEDYTPDKGKFSTYAVPWIRAYIQRGIKDGGFKILRIPRYLHHLNTSVELGTLDKSALDSPSKQKAARMITSLLSAAVPVDPDNEEFEKLCPRDEGLYNTTGYLMHGRCDHTFLAECIRGSLKEICSKRKCPERDYGIFVDRFGLREDDEAGAYRSFGEISRTYGMSRQGVRNVVSSIIKRLRSFTPADFLGKRKRLDSL